jgi:hypothetical protein
MKNLLILIVAFALFLHFYPQPKLEKWYNDKIEAALNTFPDTFDTKVRLNTDKILTDLKSEMHYFSPQERAELTQLVSSRKSVKTFYADICLAKKRQLIFRPVILSQICQTISKYTNLL